MFLPQFRPEEKVISHVTKPIVLLAEELSPATVDALGPDFEIRHCDGANRAELLSAIADVDAILIRSATKVDSEAIAAAKRLKVVARAGVGLDNVDVPAATQAGVMVVNAPTSNIGSAAELAIALLLASARNIAPANQSLKSHQWKRSKYTGVELADKVVGVVGLGRIGMLVAQRLSAFGVKLIAYDPYVQPARAAQIGIQMVSLDELLATSDFITVHLPKTPETLGLIGVDALRKVKPSVRIINAARGGIVDEKALYDALVEGRVAGAGIDVWAKEPCTDSPLQELDQVVATPHLGASTDEAQEKAGVAVAKSVRLALAGELVPDAVNVQGGAIADEVRPYLSLTEQLGQIASALANAPVAAVEVEVRGEIAKLDVKILKLSALKGLFTPLSEEQVSYVNAPLIATDRGVTSNLVTDADAGDHRNLVRIRLALSDGSAVAVGGTLSGPRDVPKLVWVDDYDLEVPLSQHLVVMRYADRPGVIGKVGKVLGDAGVNIGGMQVSRDAAGGRALMVLTVDASPEPESLARITGEINATDAAAVDLLA